MSELKYQLMLNKDMSWVPCYLKSEADKEILKLKEENERLKATPEQIMKEVFDKCLIYPKEMVRLDDAYKLAVSLRKQKYKRCLAMAKECVNGEIKLKRVKMRDMNNHQFWQFDNDYWQKWNTRWLKIAEQIKDKAMRGRDTPHNGNDRKGD